MKKLFLLLIFCLFSLGFAQKTKNVNPKPLEIVTVEQAMMSDNPKVIATFIKANPNHPKVPDLKSKLIRLITPKEDAETKPKTESFTLNNHEKKVKKGTQELPVNTKKNNQSARLLNHLFDNNPNKTEAYIQIINKSKCNLIVKFNGKKNSYNLDVPANNKNYILVDKGNYELTSSICDAKFAQSKEIDKDIVITLGTK